jgi:hypothetical protein
MLKIIQINIKYLLNKKIIEIEKKSKEKFEICKIYI